MTVRWTKLARMVFVIFGSLYVMICMADLTFLLKSAIIATLLCTVVHSTWMNRDSR